MGVFLSQSERRLSCPIREKLGNLVQSGSPVVPVKWRTPPRHRSCRPIQSHEAAARRMQRALQAQSRMRRACAHQSAAQQLAEETQHVPIVLGRALEVSTAPAPAH